MRVLTCGAGILGLLSVAAPLAAQPCDVSPYGARARDYVVSGIDARDAHDAWRRTLDGGGAVVWTASLYDVDNRSFFLLAFDRAGFRVYRFGQLVSPLRTHMGVPEWPDAEQHAFWRALEGCISDGLIPEAFVPWSAVRELRAGNWVLWFKLDRRVAIASDRGKRKSVNEIKVNLHGGSGSLEYRWNWDPYRGVENFRGIATGPAGYQERVRYTLVTMFDPEGRIKLPKQKRGAGW